MQIFWGILQSTDRILSLSKFSLCQRSVTPISPFWDVRCLGRVLMPLVQGRDLEVSEPLSASSLELLIQLGLPVPGCRLLGSKVW